MYNFVIVICFEGNRLEGERRSVGRNDDLECVYNVKLSQRNISRVL
jgi:hypothetical protein